MPVNDPINEMLEAIDKIDGNKIHLAHVKLDEKKLYESINDLLKKVPDCIITKSGVNNRGVYIVNQDELIYLTLFLTVKEVLSQYPSHF